MRESRPVIKILLPSGELFALPGSELRFELFYPEATREHLPPAEAEAIALVCLNDTGNEVGRIRMSAIVGYLYE